MLDPGRGRTRTGWLWALARDDRPWGGADPPAVAYLYADGRGAEHAAAHLDGFRGILQVDGGACPRAGQRPDPGAAYRRLEGPTLAYCWSHSRRRFYEIAEAGQAPIAEEALCRIGELYAIEAEIRGSSAAERHAARQARARSLVEALRPWHYAPAQDV